MAKVPVLVSDDLRSNLPPGSDALLTRKTSAYTVFQSGGTTGLPKASLFAHDELELISFCNARGFYATGLKASDRVANLWAVGGLYMTFVHMNRTLQQYGCTSFPFSNQTPVDFVSNVVNMFEINCFTGITSVVLNTLRAMDEKKSGARIEKIYFGGEHIYDSDREYLRKRFGTKIISAPGYGTVESWYIGYQCDRCTNGIFHSFDDMVYAEVVDEATGKHCEPGEIGMLYVSVFPRKLTPILRYRVGDRVRWMKDSCGCGRSAPLFQLLGRGDDVLRIGYDSIDYAAVQALVSKLPGFGGPLQIEKKRKDGKDQLILRIETAEAKEHWPRLIASVEAAFAQDRPSFREFVKKGTVWPLQVELLPKGSLPHNPRTGKLIRVIDAL